MIKYNYSGPGLTEGLRDRVSYLVRILKTMPGLSHLHIELKDDAKTPETAERVLTPFKELGDIRQVTCSGDISDDFAEGLRIRLESSS